MTRNDDYEALWAYLDAEDDAQLVYVYRLDAFGRMRRPYLLRCHPFPTLLEELRDVHGGGMFRILIRQGHRMLFADDVSVIVRPERPAGS